jgi:hypothetical protein
MLDVATELIAPIKKTFDYYFEGNKCPICYYSVILYYIIYNTTNYSSIIKDSYFYIFTLKFDNMVDAQHQLVVYDIAEVVKIVCCPQSLS